MALCKHPNPNPRVAPTFCRLDRTHRPQWHCDGKDQWSDGGAFIPYTGEGSTMTGDLGSPYRGQSVLRPWVHELSFMQQCVLIAAVRGPDTIRKDHVAKLLLRWYRRCIIFSAFEHREMMNPWEVDGGSFLGPSLPGRPATVEAYHGAMRDLLFDYLRTVDELPHHFQLHFMHGAQILGYKYPHYIGVFDDQARMIWFHTYTRLVNDMHLFRESEADMDARLGDNEDQWRAREEVVALQPTVIFESDV